MGKTTSAVKNKWNKANYDRIALFVPIGQKEVIKDFAAQNGESINAFINRIIREAMERDSAK